MKIQKLKGWLSRLKGRYWKPPYLYIIIAIIGTSFLDIVLFLSGNKGLFDKLEELLFSIFMEASFIFATIILIERKLDEQERNKEENDRKPIYKSAHHDLYRIWERIYYLGYKFMVEAFVYEQKRKSSDGSGYIPFVEQKYVKFIEKEKLEYLSAEEIMSRFFRNGKIRLDFSENSQSALHEFSKEIKRIYSDIENYIQRYGAFLTSKETENFGSEIYELCTLLRSFLVRIDDISDEFQSPHGCGEVSLSMEGDASFLIKGSRKEEIIKLEFLENEKRRPLFVMHAPL